MNKVAVIPVAGKGKRWWPVSRSVPKELLPVWRRTAASYALEEAIKCGYTEIIFVVSPRKDEVFRHFEHMDDSDFELSSSEKELIANHRIDIRFVVQENPAGLGHAVLCAKDAVGKRDFAVLLPDEVLPDNGLSLLSAHAPAVLLMRVPDEAREHYGIVEVEREEDEVHRIISMIEKPSPERAPSNLAVTGRYVLVPEIFDILEKTKPGKGNEIQLTDALVEYASHHRLTGVVYSGLRHDVGQPFGLLMASAEMALRDPVYGASAQKMLSDILGRY